MIVLHYKHDDHGDIIVTRLFDEHGDDTVNLEDTAAIVALLPDGKYFAANATIEDLVLLNLDDTMN